MIVQWEVPWAIQGRQRQRREELKRFMNCVTMLQELIVGGYVDLRGGWRGRRVLSINGISIVYRSAGVMIDLDEIQMSNP